MKYILIICSLLVTMNTRSAETTFVFAQINDSIMPLERNSKYEQPLNEFLTSKELGEVTGGGSMQAETGEIEWVGVDIELINPQNNIQAVAKFLKQLGAPKGSHLEYSVGEDQFKILVE